MSGVLNFSTDAQQRNQPELKMMPIRPPVQFDVFEGDGCRAIRTEMQADPFIVDLAIALAVAEGVPELF